MKPWIGLFYLAALGLVGTAGPAASAQPPIVIKFSHVVAADTPKGKASEFFKKRDRKSVV